MIKNKKLKYILIVLVVLLNTDVKSQIKNQQELSSFLIDADLPSCFSNMDSIHVDEMFRYGKTRFNRYDITFNYDEEEDVLELNSQENCHDTKKLQLKYVDYLSGDYVFLYRQHKDGDHNYGTVQLYEYQDSIWSEGKKISISWTQLFDIDKKELEELRELDQYPKCMVNFEKEGMRIEIPWKLYTYGENSQSNGYVHAGGKQPITIQYSYFLK